MISDNMSIVVDKELEQLKEFESNFHWYNENHDRLYKDYKNEYVAIKQPKVFHEKDLQKLLKILKDNYINPAHTFIEFIRDKEILYF